MPELMQIPAANVNIKKINEILDNDGCVVITDVLDAGRVQKLKNELEASFEKVPVCQGNFFGFLTKRMSSVLAKSETSRNMAINPIVSEVMDHFLLQSCRQYQLNLTQAIQICPGEPAQIIHTDDMMFPFEPPTPSHQKMINCMWAVDDFTAANGATHLVPGSHKWPRDRQPEAHEVIQGEMPAGSLLIYFGSLLHGGGANKTAKPRIGLVLSYSLGWLRQAENHYLALSQDLVRSFPIKLQKLVGYFVHEPNLGVIEGRDPIEFLHNENLDNRRFTEFIPVEFHGLMEEHRRNATAGPQDKRVA
ncbi:MAG: phytanoyl-CoA dioxygenase family protein [Alphaproteobacteria bacterium]